MRMVSTDKLTSGMQLAKPVLGNDGRVLLRDQVELSDRYIRKLKEVGISYVYVQDSETYDIESLDSIDMEVRGEVLSKIKHLYDRMADPARATDLMRSGVIGREFSNLFRALLDSVKDNPTVVLNLSAIYTSDAYLYTHCMNVGVSASVLGMAAGYNESKIMQLGIGAMLHDIGNIKVDKLILNKSGPLTAEERAEIEKHCWYGYEMLTKQADVPAVSAHCALQHHERYDGTGYPRNLKGEEIHEFGRIVGVTGVYDALTSNRHHRDAYMPHDAVEFLFSGVGTQFDKSLVDAFTRQINIYPNGLPVELSNGATGVIARPNITNLQRPVVLVLEEEGQKVSPYELDLMTQLNIVITECELTRLKHFV